MKKIEPALQSVLDQFIADDVERGLQLTVYSQGELVADLFAGTADFASGRPVDAQTLFPAFSTTKGIAATLVHVLVERGKVSYYTPIAEVWPEFAAHGKESITLRQALNHTSGLALMPMGVSRADICDWDTICAAIANQKAISPPGQEMSYHAITYGWLLGEVARRVDGRSFSQMLHDEICLPLGLTEELFMGLPDRLESRVATLEMNVDPSTLPDPDTPQSIPRVVQPLHEWMNSSDARRACVPGSNGIMTARAIARHYAALLPGGVDGVELLPPERIRLATEPQWPGNAQPGDPPMNQRLGYQIGLPFSATSFGHAGFGGSFGMADPASGVAIGFTRNRFFHDPTVPKIMETLHAALGR